MAKKSEAEAAPAAETITKAEAVKRSIAAGKDQPKEAVAWIKEEFGLDMTTQQYSTAKFQQKKKEGGPTPAKPGRKPATVAAPAAVHINGNGMHSGSPAELARAVKALVKEHGAVAVADMAKVFAD